MRAVILTVGYIHSGKTSFGRLLAATLPHTVCLERDPIAAMLNDHFGALVQATNTDSAYYGDGEKLKDRIFDMLVAEAKQNPSMNLVMTNCHTYKEYRAKMVKELKAEMPDAKIIMVYFDVDMDELEKRVRHSEKPTNVLTVSRDFVENLERQKKVFEVPTPDEAEYFFIVKNNRNTEDVIAQIKALLQD